MAHSNENTIQPRLIRDQREITNAAVDVIDAVRKNRGKPLQPRDRMALKLLTPKNSALIVTEGRRHLACRQISFEIVTDDLGKGVHKLTPSGVHVFNPQKGWWNDDYGVGQFLWNLYLKEGPEEGISRVLDRLFHFKMAGVFGSTAKVRSRNRPRTISGDVGRDLRLYIKREEGQVETTLRRMIKAKSIYLPRDLGLRVKNPSQGHIALLFGKNKRYAVSFTIERI